MALSLKYKITTSLAAAAFLIGLVEYGASNFYSVRKPFLETQTSLCKSASEAAARLATTTDSKVWGKARDEFWMLYWGPLAIVEDVDVTTRASSEPEKLLPDLKAKLITSETKFPVTDSMILFAAELIKSGPPVQPNPAGPNPADPQLKQLIPTPLQAAAYQVARACQQSIRSVWDIGIWRGIREWFW